MSVDITVDGEGNYVYEALDITNYDGDSFRLTVRKKWDFGFKIYVTQEHEIATRIKGVDTPELRDRRPDFKAAGYLARDQARFWLSEMNGPIRFISMDKPDKYGRALGDLIDQDGNKLSSFLLVNRYGVPYHGQNKAAVEEVHEKNIQYLIEKGEITV